MLLYLITIMLPIRFTAGSLALSLNRLFLIITIIPLGLSLLSGRYGRLIATDYLFLLFFIWQAVSLAMNNPGRMVEQMGSVGVEFLGGYVLGRCMVRTPQAFLGFVMGLAVCVLIAFPFAFYESTTSRPLVIELLQKLPGIVPPTHVDIEARMGLDRAQVMLPHPILFGLFCSTAFSLVLVGLKDTIGNSKRILLGGVAFVCVFFSLSSGALLSVVMQLGLITWAAIFAKNKNRWFILLGLFAAVYLAIDLASNRSPIKVFMSYATFSAHNAFWRGIIFDWGMMNVWNNPIFGLGLRGWIRPHFMPSASVDNFWLLMTMRYGFPGFLFLASGFLLLLWRVGRARLTENTTVWRLRRAWMFTMCGVTFTLATVAIWEAVYSYIFFLAGAGAWFMFYQEPDDAGQTAPAQAEGRGGLLYQRADAAPGQTPSQAKTHMTRRPDQTAETRREDETVYTRFRTRPTGPQTASRAPVRPTPQRPAETYRRPPNSDE